MPFVIEYSGVPDVENQEEFFLGCILNVYAPPSTSTARRFRARLFVDAVEIPIKSATFSANAGATDANLQIDLARLSDRSAFTRTASILLEVQEYLAGVWTTVKTYCDGAILATSNYSLQNNGSNPADTFSVTVQTVLQQTLNLTPEQFVVLYDPDKTTVDVDQLEAVPNIDGTEGAPTITPLAGLHLGDVFQFLADTYGLDGYKTNINFEPWTLSRVDFPPAQPYWNAVAGIIGNHNPRVSIVDNYLVISDGTLTDYVSARAMGLSKFSSLDLNKTIERFKGCYLTRQLMAGGWDYWTLRQRIENQWFGGVSGQYPNTYAVTWFQDFYRNSFPNTPVFSRVFHTRQLEYSDAFTLQSAVSENFSYVAMRLINRESREWSVTKAPQAWVDYNALLPSPHAEFGGVFEGVEEFYTSAGDETFTEALVLTGTRQTIHSYFPLPGEADSVYVGQTDSETRGLIMRDNDNPQLDDPFDQTLEKSQQAGNLATGQASYWGTTDRGRESQKTERPRRISLRTREHTPLNSSVGMMTDQRHDRRIGDIGESDIQFETKPLYITEGGDPTATLWRSVNGGEAPLVVLQPLCHRLNKQQDFPGGISANLPTYDETIEIGLVIDPQVEGRTSSSMGIFEIIGYTDTLNNLSNGGFKTAIQARQIA